MFAKLLAIVGVTTAVLMVPRAATAQSSHLVINEVLASNLTGPGDPDFQESGDWVEIHNPTGAPVSLNGLALSDDAALLDKWVLPPGRSVPAGGYTLIWCDDHNTAATALHANFKLSAGGESVFLSDVDTTHTIVDTISFPAAEGDQAYARIPNGGPVWELTTKPTPGAANSAGAKGPAPVLSTASGMYSTPLSVTISAPGATSIRYTTNGAAPTVDSPLYAGAININSTTPLRARAFYSNADPSDIVTAVYFYDYIADRNLPVINMVIDPADFTGPSGIWTNFNAEGEEWERAAHLVMMNPDGSGVQEAGAGARIHGGYSRSSRKKSLRFYFRKEYGTEEWTVPWLERSPVENVEQLVLRSNANDSFQVSVTSQLREATYVRDQIIRDWYAQTGEYGSDGFFAALYINGQYYGMYNACERVSDDQLERVFGGADWDVVKGKWDSARQYYTEATEGDLLAWEEFRTWLATHDITTPEGWAEMNARVDVESFVNYFALNIALQNHDWPHNNWITARRRNDPSAQWKFFCWDSEWAIGLNPNGYTSNTINWVIYENYQWVRRREIPPLSMIFAGNDMVTNPNPVIKGIIDNPQGRMMFIGAMEDVLNFVIPPQKAVSDFNTLVGDIQTEIPREATRWATSVSAPQLLTYWNGAVNNFRTFLQSRPFIMRNHMIQYFGLGGASTITFNKSGDGEGKLLVRGHLVDLPWTGTFFAGSEVEVSGIARNGSTFAGWSGGITGTQTDKMLVAGTANHSVSLIFTAGASSAPQPNDVIINEYWVNDVANEYPVVGVIEGDWVELLVVKNGLDMRGWRLTNNTTVAQRSTVDDGDGSLLFPAHDTLASLSTGTIVLVLTSTNETNSTSFPEDDLDDSDRLIVLVRGNGNLDDQSDPGFSMRTSDEAIVLLAPAQSTSFADDILIDFIAEGTRVTPTAFLGSQNNSWPNPFAGIGDNDGAIFTNDPSGGFNNDDGSDSNRNDALPGPGGWLVDPPAQFTGDAVGATNIMTPGRPNKFQNIRALRPVFDGAWVLY